MAVWGPSNCGKTEIVFEMLLKNTFSSKFESILCFYQRDQSKFQFIKRKINIQFMKFSTSFKQISEIDYCLWVFDDSCEEVLNDRKILKRQPEVIKKSVLFT